MDCKVAAMELFETVLIALQITNIFARKKYKGVSSSEESIENILYYKDCNHKRRNNIEPMKLKEPLLPPPKQQECKMCCSMCCGEDCVNQQTCFGAQRSPGSPVTNERIMRPNQNQPREPDAPIQPPLRVRKKKVKQSLLPPISGRRDFSFTRENIKNLIAQDEDIKKILKDLVKVTMQKVDLVEMINARRNQVDGPDVSVAESQNEEES